MGDEARELMVGMYIVVDSETVQCLESVPQEGPVQYTVAKIWGWTPGCAAQSFIYDHASERLSDFTMFLYQ